MRILYISDQGDRADYLRDSVAHGFRSMLGEDFVDINKIEVLYDTFPDSASIYGRGFTLYKLLPDISVDRTDVEKKIRSKYFDLIIYGSIHRCQTHLRLVVDTYPHERVVFIDGEDHPGYLQGLGGRTFKRELYNPQPGCHPISFAIPREKIRKSPGNKDRIMAPCDPLDRSTYIYKTEKEYYAQYAFSYYGPTMKKAGWDCLRHYEILANWSIPYFRVMEQLPSLICTTLPKPELMLAKTAIEYWCYDRSNMKMHSELKNLYEAIIEPVMKVVKERMTTEALAKYIINTIGVSLKA